MKSLKKIGFLGLICLALLSTVETVKAEQSDQDFVPGQVIVGMKNNVMSRSGISRHSFPGIDVAGVEVLLNPTTNTNARSSQNEAEVILFLDLVEDTEQSVLDAIELLETHPNVMYAEPDYIVYGDALLENTNQDSSSRHNTSLLWNMERIGLAQAWNTTSGNSSIKVGVIDSGIDHTHPNLAPNVDTSLGYDFVLNRSDASDVQGHGTHVAGIIGARGSNNHHVVGVAPDVTLVSLRVLNEQNSGSTSNIIRAIDYANYLGLDLINHSISGAQYSQAREAAIKAFNGLFITTAGNLGSDNDIVHRDPASLDIPNMITVGSSDEQDQRSIHPTWASNWGRNSVDLFAPGSNIASTARGNTFRTGSGTSYAAPIVTGAAVLALSVNPSLTPVELKAAILDTVDPVPALANYSATGGRLNVERLVEQVAVSTPEKPNESTVHQIEWVSRQDENQILENHTTVEVARNFVDRHDRSVINLLLRGEDRQPLDLTQYELTFSNSGVLGETTTTLEWQERGHVHLPILTSGETTIYLQHKETQEVEELLTFNVTPGNLTSVRGIQWVTRLDADQSLTSQSVVEVERDFLDRHGRPVINLLLRGEGNQPLDLTQYELIFSTEGVLGATTTTLEWQERGHVHFPILNSGETVVVLRNKETLQVEELLTFIVISDNEIEIPIEPETPIQPEVPEIPTEPETPIQPEVPTAPAFNSRTVYVGGEIVYYNGNLYRAKWWTQGGSPAASSAWEIIPQVHADGSVDFRAANVYVAGDLVRFEGNLYRARWWTQGGTPTSGQAWEFVGPIGS